MVDKSSKSWEEKMGLYAVCKDAKYDFLGINQKLVSWGEYRHCIKHQNQPINQYLFSAHYVPDWTPGHTKVLKRNSRIDSLKAVRWWRAGAQPKVSVWGWWEWWIKKELLVCVFFKQETSQGAQTSFGDERKWTDSGGSHSEKKKWSQLFYLTPCKVQWKEHWTWIWIPALPSN